MTRSESGPFTSDDDHDGAAAPTMSHHDSASAVAAVGGDDFCQFQLGDHCSEEDEKEAAAALESSCSRPPKYPSSSPSMSSSSGREVRESSDESAASAIMAAEGSTSRGSVSSSSGVGRVGSAAKDKKQNQKRSIPRPTSIFGHQHQHHPGAASLPADPPSHVLMPFGSSTNDGGGSNKPSRMVVPKIKCSSHFHGASAPSTPSNGQQLPWIHGAGVAGGEHNFRSPLQQVQHRQDSIGSIDEEAREASAFLSPEDAISVNSVELASPAHDHYQSSATHSSSGSSKRRSKSRLSLHLIGSPGNRPTSPTAGKSPSFIPKFLRSSFSKLLSRDRKTSAGSNASSPPKEALGTSVDSSGILNNNDSSMRKSASSAGFVPSKSGTSPAPDATGSSSDGGGGGFAEASPDTLEYMEQAKMSGLPVIPFAFPTSVIAEKMQNKRAAAAAAGADSSSSSSVAGTTASRKSKNPSGDSNKSEPLNIVNKDGSAAAARDRRRSGKKLQQDSEEDEDEVDFLAGNGEDDFGPKSLENLVNMAQRELRMETMYDIYSNDDVIAGCDLGLVAEGISKSKVAQQGNKRRRRRKVAREPSSEEGYVEMAPNVHSRNPSPTPPTRNSSSNNSNILASPFTSPPQRKAWASYGGEEDEDEEGEGEESGGSFKQSSGGARCLLTADSPTARNKESEEEHFEMDFSKN